MSLADIVSHTAAAAAAALAGNPLDVARHAADALAASVSPEEARRHLQEATIRRANLAADLAEAAKFAKLGEDEP